MLRRPAIGVLAFLLGSIVTSTVPGNGFDAGLADHPEMLERPSVSQQISGILSEPIAAGELVVGDATNVYWEDSLLPGRIRPVRGLKVSFAGMIGRRVFQPSEFGSTLENAGFRLRLQADLEAAFLGYSSWEATADWLRGDSFGFIERSMYREVYDLSIGVGPPPLLYPFEAKTDVRLENRGVQTLASGQWNLRRKLNATVDQNRTVSQLLGVRYLFSGEESDTQAFSTTTYYDLHHVVERRIDRAPFDAFDVANQMIGIQFGYDAAWVIDRFQLSGRVLAGLMGNYASINGWQAESSWTVFPSSPVRREFFDDAFRLSTLIELDASLVYSYNRSVDFNCSTYAILLTGQGVGDMLDTFNPEDDLTLVGLRFGATYHR